MNDRILIVEDNPDLAANLAELLEDEGAHVALASSGDSALTQAGETTFGLVVVDMRLGPESGLDLVPHFKALQPQCEVILITGNATLDSAIEAIGRGVFAYVQKPFAPDQILTLARRALAQVSLRREKQALAERLQASEALYRDVVETVEACILGVDRQGIVRFANQHTCVCSGLPMEEIIDHSFAKLWQHAGMGDDLEDVLEQALSGSGIRDVERSLLRAGGETRIIRWTMASLEQSGTHYDGDAARILAVGLDVTDRVELEKRDAENQALAAMGTLTTGLAHEIRNPLNAAKLQLELLVRRARRSTDPETAERLVGPAEIVRDEIERLSDLLNEFLQLARPRALERMPVRLQALFGSVLELQRPVAEAAGLTLVAHVTPPDISVRGDQDRLKQVLLNLVSNAVDAMRERRHGHIELSCEPADDGQVCIRVTDDGPGIAPEVREAAFQPFVTNKEAGTGLGLAIVKTLVERHGGRVSLLPAEPQGTVVEVILPGRDDSTPPGAH